MTYIYTDLIRAAYRGEMAHRHVTAISGFHRIQASPGYRAAAHYVAEQLSDAGLQVNVLGYPADDATRFWQSPSFLEWSCEAATLHLLPPDGERPQDKAAHPTLLCDFGVTPISLIQRSISVEGEFEVVAPRGKGGLEPADYEGLDVAGKVVLTNKPVGQVTAVAVRQLGAAGILFDGMQAGGRTDLDLPDALQYTSFWWAGQAEPDAWGFVISPRQGRVLRERLEKGETLRVRASIDSELYPGAIEVVEALLPGDEMADGEEILLVSHLCHPQPGAHDNASGAAALLEAAVTLARLISDGRLPAPRRGIRFIWPPEMTGTFAYLAGEKRGRGHLRRGRRHPGTAALDRRPEFGHGGRGPGEDGRPVGARQPPAGRGLVRRSPVELAARAVPARHPLHRDAVQRRVRPLHPLGSHRRHPLAHAHPLARPLLPYVGGYAREGQPGQPGAERCAGRDLCLLAGDRGARGGGVAGAPDGFPVRRTGRAMRQRRSSRP